MDRGRLYFHCVQQVSPVKSLSANEALDSNLHIDIRVTLVSITAEGEEGQAYLNREHHIEAFLQRVDRRVGQRQ